MRQRILAVIRARLREFYRDKASLMWNLAMPILIIFGFAFIFSDKPDDLFKVGILTQDAAGDTQHTTFLATRYIKFIPVTELDEAVTKVQRHQLDMLLVSGAPPRYWINQHSANGYMVERVLQAAYGSVDTAPRREIVSGTNIRYADWLMPGVLAMNMMFSCLWGVGWVVVRYRKNGVLRRLQATPLTAFEFLTAQVIARLIIIVVVTLLVYAGADYFIDFTMRGSYLALFLVFFAGAACLTSMGLVVATRLKTEELADGLLNFISWPMMILSGVWFSMEGTNPVAQGLSQIFPLTHLVNAARRIMIDGAGLAAVGFEIALLSALTLLLLLVSAYLIRWA